ncbi:Nephrocystin-3 [Trichoplax sp. H2]|nr:Nephrocystin-3 [Trichoplax sp. H2]|eukprot:RDD39302.1 Nephrocystin-3 [Trichoplax sp. H2]
MDDQSIKSTTLDEIKSVYETGVKFDKKSYYERTLFYYQQAATQIQSIQESSESRLYLEYDLYFDMANCYLKENELMKASLRREIADILSKKLLDEIKLEQLGDDHLEIATLYGNIGLVYSKQGKYDEALSMYNKSLKIKLAHLGNNHPSIATVYNGIGLVYYYLGKYDDALSVYKESLKVEQAQLGDNHPRIATTCNIGLTYYKLDNFNDALSMYKKSVRIRLATLGENHPDTALSFRNQAQVNYQQSNYRQAISFYQKVHQ